MWVQSLGWEDPLEKGMVTCSSILAWRVSPKDRGAWWATVHRVAKSRTGLKWHNMHTCTIKTEGKFLGFPGAFDSAYALKHWGRTRVPLPFSLLFFSQGQI